MAGAAPCTFAGQVTPLMPVGPPAPGQANGPAGIFETPREIQVATDLWERQTGRVLTPRDGVFLELGDMITGAGWPSAGPAFRRRVFGGAARVSGSAQLSVRLYKAATLRLEVPQERRPFSLGGQVTFLDSVRVNYFGLGPDTVHGARSGYRLRSTDMLAFGSWTRGRATVAGRVGRLVGVRVGPMAGRDVGYPDVVDRFTDAEAPGLAEQPSFLHGDIAFEFHTRDPNAHPTRGGQYEVSWTGFADRDGTRQSSSRVELAASRFVPLGTENVVFALSGWTAMTRTEGDNRVPFYLLPTLGGRNTLRGFHDFRFHDRHLATFTAETRVAILRYLDAAVFVDVGNVGSTVRALWNRPFKSSVGVGVRYHNGPRLIGRLELARGREGWEFIARLIDPLTRSTPLGDRPLVIPFLP